MIDGPPSLAFFTINAMMAASEILLSLQVQAYAYKALDQLLSIVDKMREIQPNQMGGIVLTMHDRRNALAATIEAKKFGNLVYQTTITVNVRIAEAPFDGGSIGKYETSSKGPEAYRDLAVEVLSE